LILLLVMVIQMDGGNNIVDVQRGDIWLVRHDPVEGSEQAGVRPLLIVQHDVLNRYGATTIGFSLSSRQKKEYRTYVLLPAKETGLNCVSVVMTDQVRTISKRRLIKKLGSISFDVMRKVEMAFLITFGVSR
jgi:mRNA interferase MazF